MKAFILCGGKGTRLRPYTDAIPKPMLKLGQKPILQYVIENTSRYGITDLILTIGYKKEQIKEYFKDGADFGVHITYLEEDEPKNTAGSILDYQENIDETFMVLMGDHLTNINLSKMINHHKQTKALATIGTKEVGQRLEYGVLHLDEGQENVTRFEEKPAQMYYINTGIYVFEPEVYDYIKPYEDFGRDVLPRLIKEKKKVVPYLFPEYWIDVGRVQDYEKLNEFMNIASLVFDLQHKL